MCLIHDVLALLGAGTTFTAGLSAFAATKLRRRPSATGATAIRIGGAQHG